MCILEKKECSSFVQYSLRMGQVINTGLITRTSCSTLACSQLKLQIFSVLVKAQLHLASAQIFFKFYVFQ